MVRRREEEVLEIIKNDPLISQKDIAERLNITRSSVGVHVNNLTKKGKIVGRGYVLSKVDKICVIGGSNIDVYGNSSDVLRHGQSNSGTVSISVGGVSRNIADNLSKLGLSVELITAISDDEYGKYIQSYCLKEGIRIDKSNVFRNQRTSFYLAILNENQELEYGISDMSIMNQITPAFINQRRLEINNSKMIAIDLNLPRNTVEFILTNFKSKKIFVDPGTIDKIDKIENQLDKIFLLKLTSQELSAISGIEIGGDKEKVKEAAKLLLDRGLKNLVVSNGLDAICFISRDKYYKVEENFKDYINREGVSEAQFAGIIYGYINGLEIEETLKIAIEAGAITSETKAVVSPWLSISNIIERLDNNE